MTARHGIRINAVATLASALLVSNASVADNQADRDSREVSSYVLTEAALAKYTQAVHNLGQLVKTLPGNCDDSDKAKSLNDLAARMDAVPKIKGAMKSAGISSREYLIFTMSLFQNGMAAWVLAQPGAKVPPGVSMANVKFYQAHDVALKKLSQETKPGECEEDARGSDSGE